MRRVRISSILSLASSQELRALRPHSLDFRPHLERHPTRSTLLPDFQDFGDGFCRSLRFRSILKAVDNFGTAPNWQDSTTSTLLANFPDFNDFADLANFRNRQRIGDALSRFHPYTQQEGNGHNSPLTSIILKIARLSRFGTKSEPRHDIHLAQLSLACYETPPPYKTHPLRLRFACSETAPHYSTRLASSVSCMLRNRAT